MATLVLSTVGSSLGGPVGGAIGALIGQSIDEQLLSPVRRGPRLNDLNVQTSSYGTQMPRIYGTMRVAGSVVWATDLIESGQTSGAKGQPDIIYSYSVSLAVALSSRPIAAIRRIWADGKLLRGENGDFKVSTAFRFYSGSEDQQIDPLIASIESIANTPAYRGLALAVFENLELADFGNRIPFMTFEVVGEVDPPSIGAVLNDASKGLIMADAPQEIGGYAAYGQSIRAAIQPLVDCYAVELFDDGLNLRPPSTVDPQAVGNEDLGNSAGYEAAPRIEREQTPATTLPGTLRLGYYDPQRDYQAGEARASASEQRFNEERSELPGAISAAAAKSLAHQMLARQWARRDRLTLRLSPRFLGLEPGARLELQLNPRTWSVERCTIDGFAVTTELRPAWIASPPMLAEAGRIRANVDVEAGPLSLAPLDVRNVSLQDFSAPTLLLAASSATPGWKRRSIEVNFAGQSVATSTARRKSVLGRALTVLPVSEPYLIDNVSTVDVELVDPDQWLTNCDDDALATGANIAVVGSELIQFGGVAPLGQGQFRLSRLLRGRGGTEWACSSHAVDEVFCVIERGAVQQLTVPAWSVGALVTVSAQNSPAASTIVSAETLRPPAPVNLAAKIEPAGDLFVSWTRRSREGWAWIDEIDAPLAERVEQYRITIMGLAGSAELTSDQETLSVPAATIAGLGTGLAAIEVRQVGDLAASRPAQFSINLP